MDIGQTIWYLKELQEHVEMIKKLSKNDIPDYRHFSDEEVVLEVLKEKIEQLKQTN